MRIGELLISDGVLTAAHVELGLRTQRQYGGRLASTLVQLGYVDADVATRALGKLLRVPAALQKHFDGADVRTIKRFPRRVAEKYCALGLGFATDKSMIVAMRDPRHLPAVEEIQFITGTRIMAAIAIEMRIVAALERHYGVAEGESRRFVALGSAPTSDWEQEPQSSRYEVAPITTSVPQMPTPAMRRPTPEARRAIELTLDPPPPPPPPLPSIAPAPASVAPPPMSAPPASQLPTLPAALEAPPTRRHDYEVEPVHAPPSSRTDSDGGSLPPMTEPPPHGPLESEQRLAFDPRSDGPPARVTESIGPGSTSYVRRATPMARRTAVSAIEAIKRLVPNLHRDDVASVVVDYLRSTFACGIVFAVRNDIAIGWKGFAPGVPESSIGAMAIPLTQPSLLMLPYEGRTMFCGPPPAYGDEIHQRLWKLLRTQAPREAIVIPMVVEEHVEALVYAHPPAGENLVASSVLDLTHVCAAASKVLL